MVLQADEATVTFETGHLFAVGLRELSQVSVDHLFSVDPDLAFFAGAENAQGLPLSGGPGSALRGSLHRVDRCGELVGPEVFPFRAVIIQQLDLHAIDIGCSHLRRADKDAAVAVLRQLVLQREIKITVLFSGRQPLRPPPTGSCEHTILNAPVAGLTPHALPATQVFTVEESCSLLQCLGRGWKAQQNKQAGREDTFHWVSPLAKRDG